MPSATLPYFYLSTARDPRPIIVHEGVPGHYLQLALSWAHENPIRRHYYDSNSNEGIGFYAEELMLQEGLFDDSPRSREIIYNFMRLRALRVEVDVQLAIGEFTIDRPPSNSRRRVPMDRATALEEAAFFAARPARRSPTRPASSRSSASSPTPGRSWATVLLRAFHDFVWKNGNVPLALQRWELLGDAREVARLDQLR